MVQRELALQLRSVLGRGEHGDRRSPRLQRRSARAGARIRWGRCTARGRRRDGPPGRSGVRRRARREEAGASRVPSRVRGLSLRGSRLSGPTGARRRRSCQDPGRVGARNRGRSERRRGPACGDAHHSRLSACTHRYGFASSRPLHASPPGVHGYATPASAGGGGKTTMREYQSGTADAAGNATFGPGLVFEGKLSFQGQVRFDGTFTGEITTDDLLIIGETPKVSADITCGSVVINGEVTGKIKARDSVELRGHARVKADLATPSLVMDKGVVFDGYCNMMDKRDVVPLPTGDERRKSWQSGRNKHQDRRPNRDVVEAQPADLSAQ